MRAIRLIDVDQSPLLSCAMWWTIRNSGNEPWPHDVRLQYTGGNHQLSSDQQTIYVSNIVYPKHRTTMVVDFITPSEPGWYHSTWKMMTSAGVNFGGTIRYDTIPTYYTLLFRRRVDSRYSILNYAAVVFVFTVRFHRRYLFYVRVDMLSLVFRVQVRLEDTEEDSLSAELASRMALIDRPNMEEDLNFDPSVTVSQRSSDRLETDEKVRKL